MARNGYVTQFTLWMENSISYHDGVLPVEPRRAGRVPGSVLQKGPPQVTDGRPVLMWGARLRRRMVDATGQKYSDPDRTTRPLNILSGMQRGSTTRRFSLQSDCIEKILMWPASRRHTWTPTTDLPSEVTKPSGWTGKEGTKEECWYFFQNSIAASDLKWAQNQQTEIHGVNIPVDNSAISIFNLNCPPPPPPPPPTWQRSLTAKH